jgi:hypothetical protein
VSASRDTRVSSYLERTAIWIPASIIGLLMLPMVVTGRSFGPDWTVHLWAVRQQQWNIEAMGHPGLFLSAKPLGAFYPIFAFVGSGIYSFGGYLAIVVGPIIAYKLLNLAGLCFAYGGFTWLSVQFGLRGWRSQVPGAVFVTGAYFITDMVGRGDFAEFIAVASIPFLIAAICAIVISPRVCLRHRLAVVVAVFVLSGSHNITLLWGSTFVALLGLLAVLAWAPTWRRPLPWRRLGQLVGLGAIGAGLNAWYLFPDLAYGLDTVVGWVSKNTRPGTIFVHPALLLNPFRPSDHSPSIVRFFARDIRLSLPCLFFAWALVVAVVLWRERDWAAKRLFLGLLVLTGVFVVLVVADGPWNWLPHVFWSTQFTWRLDAYVLLATALLVMIVLRWQANASDSVTRWTTVALAAIVVFNVGAATWQVWRVRSEFVKGAFEVPTHGHFAEKVIASHYVVPRSWYAQGDFRDISLPFVAVGGGRKMAVPIPKIRGASFSGTLDVPDGGTPFATNISAGPRLVQMTGIKAVGRTFDGFIVAARASNAPPEGPIVVTIRQADSAPVRAGAIVSVLSALALLGLIAWPARRLLHRSPIARTEPSAEARS